MPATGKCLDLGIVGLGECGGNLAVEFDRLGYRSLALNTSSTDLRGVALPPERRLYVGLDGRDGAGQDMALGQRALESHSDAIVARVGSQLRGCDQLLVCGGLGGGTGSNVAILANIVSRVGIPVSALVALPKNQESSIVKLNAVNAVNQFRNTDVTSIVMIDNEKILRHFRNGSLTTFYAEANKAAVVTLHEMNAISGNAELLPIRGFDGEDFRRVFGSRGVLIYGSANLVEDDLLVRDRLANNLRSIWESSGLLAAGFEYQDSTMAGVVLVAPKDLLDKAPADTFEMLIKQIRDLTGASGIYTGLFQSPNGQPPRLYTMLGGLPFPERLRQVLTQAKEEGPSLGSKVARPIEELDLGEIEGLDIFTGSIGSPMTPAPAPPPRREGTASLTADELSTSAAELARTRPPLR